MVFAAGLHGGALGIFFVVVLIAGFVGVGALLWIVLRRAPRDGSDVGMAPDEHREPSSEPSESV